MTKEEREMLESLRNDVEEVLSIDPDYLTMKVKENPKLIIGTVKSGFSILYSFLDNFLNGDN